MAYIEISNFTSDSYFNQDIDIEYEGEVNIVELKLGSHYVCQMLKPEDNRNNFLNAKYNFDVSKAYKVFDIFLKDKYIILLNGPKFPFNEQWTGQTYRNVFDHWTNNCICFKDLIQKEISEGWLKFKERPMKVHTDPFVA